MKKVVLTIMLVIGLMSQAQASEPDYVAPIIVGGVVVIAGILTGGFAFIVFGATAGTAVGVGSATVIGGSYVATLDD